MGEDFQSNNWWKTSSSSGGGYDGGSPATSNVSCSTTITDVAGVPFSWVAAGGGARPLIDSTLQLSGGFGLSSSSMDWSQTLLTRGESGFQAMLQEDHNSRSDFSAAGEPSTSVQVRDMNQAFFFPEQTLFDNQHVVHYQDSQFMQQKQQSGIINHLQFTNNAPFWNASSSSSIPFDLHMKKNCSEPVMKKIRIETPSTLPTFKVKKEKLGDRITALQQLVSPFGKTDTASVLHEAIECIKLLHEQVSVLSTPYLKNCHPMQQQHQGLEKFKDNEWQNQDLRSRGLCLVPISSTYPVATETTPDFWIPTFGGNYR